MNIFVPNYVPEYFVILGMLLQERWQSKRKQECWR